MAGFARKVLEAAFVGEYGRELQEQSALNLLLALEGQGEQLYEHGAERYRLAEGNDALAQRLAQGLDGPVELGSALESLRADGPGYLLGLRRGAASHELRADLVVLALPFTLLRQVELRLELPEAKRRAVAERATARTARSWPASAGARGARPAARATSSRTWASSPAGTPAGASPAPTR